MIDDRTSNLSLQKPNAANTLLEDVVRLRAALDAIDAEIEARQLVSAKGAAGGYAGLDGSGKVPSAQLPSYVDDVLEYANLAGFPGTGETAKIYVALDTNKTYRWSGSAYVEISASPGTTDNVTEGSTNLYHTAARARAAQFIATASVLGLVKIGPTLTVDGAGQIDVGSSTQTFEDSALTIGSDGQTVFTISGGYSAGLIDVHLNGAKLNGGGDDYTASNGTTITLTAGVNTTDLLVLRRWAVFNVASVPFSAITSKPTTLAGYGITDATTKDLFAQYNKADLMANAPLGLWVAYADATGSGSDWPTTNGVAWWNVITFGSSTRKTQIAQQVFSTANDASIVFTRSLHDAVWSAWSPIGGTDYVQVISGNTTAAVGATYVLTASLTLTLPASPLAGHSVGFSNRSGTTTAVIARNGQNIMGLAENMTLDDLNANARLVFADATRGWVLA